MIAFALAGIVVSLVITALVTKVCALVGLHETQSALMDRLLKGPGWFLVFLVTNGALLTEVSFRAYVIERIGELISGRVVLTAVIQIIVTTSIFIGGRGLAHGVVWFLDDVVFTAYYIKYRNTSVCIASHAVPNLIASGLIALRLAH
jgi:membrane protease YdiL (CAAX protease family)